jgi:hypothetical protein
MFCEILEKEYSDFRYAHAHHFSLDAYACPYPGKETISQAANSVLSIRNPMLLKSSVEERTDRTSTSDNPPNRLTERAF